MTAIQHIQQIMAGVLKYGALASAAVAQVQAEVGASQGDAGVQLTKKQTAVLYILAAAHAGESVPNSTVQTVSAVVDFVAGTAKAMGLFGKVAAGGGSVSVPAVGVK